MVKIGTFAPWLYVNHTCVVVTKCDSLWKGRSGLISNVRGISVCYGGGGGLNSSVHGGRSVRRSHCDRAASSKAHPGT